MANWKDAIWKHKLTGAIKQEAHPLATIPLDWACIWIFMNLRCTLQTATPFRKHLGGNKGRSRRKKNNRVKTCQRRAVKISGANRSSTNLPWKSSSMKSAWTQNVDNWSTDKN